MKKNCDDCERTVEVDIGCGTLLALAMICFTLIAIFGH